MSTTVINPAKDVEEIRDPEFHKKLTAFLHTYLRFRTGNYHSRDLHVIPEFVPARIRTAETMRIYYQRVFQALPAGEYDCTATLHGLPVVEGEDGRIVQVPVIDCEILSLAVNNKRLILIAELEAATISEAIAEA